MLIIILYYIPTLKKYNPVLLLITYTEIWLISTLISLFKQIEENKIKEQFIMKHYSCNLKLS